MALLTEAQRVEAWEKFMRENLEDISVLKMDLKAAIDAIDNHLDITESSTISAIAAPVRTALSAAQQKALIFAVQRARGEM